MTTPCPSTNDLHGLVNGSLSDSEADSVQLHLERCETCQNALQEIVADGDFWKSAAENLSNDEAAGPGLERVVDELQHQSPEDAEEMGEAIELKLSFIEPPTEPGTIGRLKHYDILRVAGRGGMGIVLKAFDRTLRRVVAVKMLAPHLAGNGQARQRFVREGRSAAGICHEHVVTIHAVEESPPFIVMQYVKGETLEARIHRNGSLEVREAIRIAKQIAQGLAAAHTQGVVHRDIKPANILLENGVARVRITDFGLARAVDDASLTQSGVIAGTPQYMAPEQANGDPVDERADLFSLGSVLYTTLAGHAPFRATTTMGVLKRLCDHNARPIREINPDVPDWLVVMINRLHAKRPADRYQSAQEAADVLERGLAAMQNGASPTVDLPALNSATSDPAMTVDASVVGDRVVEGAETSETAKVISQEARAELSTADLKRLTLGWMFRPMALWMVFVIVGVCVTPFVPSAGVLAAVLAVAWFVVQGLMADRRKASPEEGETSTQSAKNATIELRFDNFFLVRIVRGIFEIAPRSFGECIAWLIVWLAPAFVWASVFFIQEDRVHSGVSPRQVDEIDLELLLVGYGVCAVWMLVGLLWFRRRRLDGTTLFARGVRWRGVLGTVGLASIFVVCGYQTWKCDVYMNVIGPRGPRAATIVMEAPRETTITRYSMVRVNFEAAVDDMELVIDFPNDREVTFRSAHHGIIIKLSEPPGMYEWRAIHRGQHVASGKVTLTEGQLAEIKVPRPTLSQLIAGRWESDPKTNGFSGMALDGGADDSGVQYEFEFENDLATIAVRASGQVDRSQYRVRIDESVTPALIDLSLPDGQQLIGIAKFQAGRKSNFQRHSPNMMSSLFLDGSEMVKTVDDMESGSSYEDAASPEGGMFMGMGAPGIASSIEPDRLLLCVTEGNGLRPWEFQADEERGHIIFALVRSRESGSLREKLAFEPVKLETSSDMIDESVQAWSKRLKIDDEGTNSVGMKMVLVPPAAYHLVDQPHLAALRRELPEPSPIRDDPTFKYEFPPKLKEQISKRAKSVSYPFVISRRLVTVDQFRQFIDETHYVTDAEKGTPLLVDVSSDSDAGLAKSSEASTSETDAEQESPAEGQGGWRREGRLFNRVDGLSWQTEESALNNGDGLPVEVISWRDATEFCKWLSEKEGRQYRLPKNEEWTAAMQLGAARKQLPATNSDDPMIHDYYGWFDARSRHPLGITRTNETFAEWTQDAQFGSRPDRMVLVHHEESADGVRFYLGTQFIADKSFRASGIGFRVVAELQVLAVEKSNEESPDSPTAVFTE